MQKVKGEKGKKNPKQLSARFDITGKMLLFSFVNHFTISSCSSNINLKQCQSMDSYPNDNTKKQKS